MRVIAAVAGSAAVMIDSSEVWQAASDMTHVVSWVVEWCPFIPRAWRASLVYTTQYEHSTYVAGIDGWGMSAT